MEVEDNGAWFWPVMEFRSSGETVMSKVPSLSTGVGVDVSSLDVDEPILFLGLRLWELLLDGVVYYTRYTRYIVNYDFFFFPAFQAL